MKIKLVKKRDGSTIEFRAENHGEGVDLKDFVLSLGRPANECLANHLAKEPSIESMSAAIEELGKRGYELTKETRNTREFTVKKGKT
jgi:hypothetical protein